MFRGTSNGRNSDEMAKRPVIARALLGPVAVLATLVLVAWQSHSAGGVVNYGGIAVAWVAALVLRRMVRRRQLIPLLAQPPRTMRKLTLAELVGSDMGRESDAPSTTSVDYAPRPLADRLAKAMASRRLVLLCGERLSGRSGTAFAVCHQAFGGYKVLRPARAADTGMPPLTTLLTSGVLSLRKRYILWLDDVGLLLDAGFDPRIVERWLAAGLGRVAVGTITPAELERIRAAGTSAAFALERAAHVTIEPAPDTAHKGSVVETYRGKIISDPQAAAVIRIVATCELLGLRQHTEAFYQALIERVTGRSLTSKRIDDLWPRGVRAIASSRGPRRANACGASGAHGGG